MLPNEFTVKIIKKWRFNGTAFFFGFLAMQRKTKYTGRIRYERMAGRPVAGD